MLERYRQNTGKCNTALMRMARTTADEGYSAITLTKNSQFYVRQGDVERLIAQGYLHKLG